MAVEMKRVVEAELAASAESFFNGADLGRQEAFYGFSAAAGQKKNTR